ncbi:MAG: phosphomannomutase [bacterium]
MVETPGTSMTNLLTGGLAPFGLLPEAASTAEDAEQAAADVTPFDTAANLTTDISALPVQLPSTVYLASGQLPPGISSMARSVPPAGGAGNGHGQTRFKISDLMGSSGVAFGTSGARGKVEDMTDRICFAYTAAFLQHLEDVGGLLPGTQVAIGGDLRPSTARIMLAVAKAVWHMACGVINLGEVPSPAIALYGIAKHIPTIMVTGSHIPDDRNGIKFNNATGEILKQDEAGIRAQTVCIPPHLFKEDGSFAYGDRLLPHLDFEAQTMFHRRYTDFFGEQFLKGKRIALYAHSAVGRMMLHRALTALGADVTTIGHSNTFIPVDTEAIRDEDVNLAREWAKEYGFDAIVSTDGDSDRPLIAGRDGEWLRGDVLGILVAKFLNADSVTAPVSSNSALELSGLFPEVRRTRIGSPYVISSMMQARQQGRSRVVGYEANGGFLTATDIEVNGRKLSTLPTRDSFLPILAALRLAVAEGKGVEELVNELPSRYTASDRIKDFQTDRSRKIIEMFTRGDFDSNARAIEAHFGSHFGKVKSIDVTDGLRIAFQSGEILHLRPSGNAPEFRVYTEADSSQRAMNMNRLGLDVVRYIPVG